MGLGLLFLDEGHLALRRPRDREVAEVGPVLVAVAAVAAVALRAGLVASAGLAPAALGPADAAAHERRREGLGDAEARDDDAERVRGDDAAPGPKSNLQPDFNVSAFDSFDARFSESNRFVQESAESTPI